MKKFFLLSLALIFILACRRGEQIPNNVLSKEKMQAVMWDMMNASQYLSLYVLSKDSVDKKAETVRIYGQVFQVNQITKAQFEKSYEYYRDHPALMKVIMDSLNRRQTYTVEKFQRDTVRKKMGIPGK
jgi:Domain of unknown function (DUF4296)